MHESNFTAHIKFLFLFCFFQVVKENHSIKSMLYLIKYKVLCNVHKLRLPGQAQGVAASGSKQLQP